MSYEYSTPRDDRNGTIFAVAFIAFWIAWAAYADYHDSQLPPNNIVCVDDAHGHALCGVPYK
jgi:hypothetical protein